MSAARRRLAAWWRERPVVPAGEQSPWVARQVKANADHLKAMQAQVDALVARFDNGDEALRRVFGAAGCSLPPAMKADAPTEPILRVVGG